MSKKSVFLSLDNWYPYITGPNVVVENYTKHMNANGNKCSLIVPSFGKKTDAEVDSKRSFHPFRVKSIVLGPLGLSGATPNHDKKLWKLLDEEKPELLHSHTPFILGRYFAKYGKKHHIPTIMTVHTNYKNDFMRVTHSRLLTRFMTWYSLQNMNNTDYIWTVSNGAAELIRDFGYKGDITVIRNGTDMTPLPEDKAKFYLDKLNSEYNLTGKENILLFVGRVVTSKNLELIFDTLRLLNKGEKKFTMLIVGKGEMLKPYKKSTADLGENIIFTGEITDRDYLKAFYMRSDLFVFPSSYDTASLVPIEAATFSLPTILIKGCPTSETVQDDFSGFCEEPVAEKWAERINSIFADKEKLKTVSENAKKYVYRSWADVVREVEEHYDAILNKSK